MKKILNFLFIISIIVIIVYLGLYIFEEYFLSNIYTTNSQSYDLLDEDRAIDLKNVVIKYLTLSSNPNYINDFMPIGRRNNQKIDNYIKVISEKKYIHINKMSYFNDTTYLVNYSVFDDENESYDLIIKINKNKNYFKILYDELYELGRKVNE